MAPSTPPPPINPEFAAFTMASVFCTVISPWMIDRVVSLILILETGLSIPILLFPGHFSLFFNLFYFFQDAGKNFSYHTLYQVIGNTFFGQRSRFGVHLNYFRQSSFFGYS